jgi:hypothetical protein
MPNNTVLLCGEIELRVWRGRTYFVHQGALWQPLVAFSLAPPAIVAGMGGLVLLACCRFADHGLHLMIRQSDYKAVSQSREQIRYNDVWPGCRGFCATGDCRWKADEAAYLRPLSHPSPHSASGVR